MVAFTQLSSLQTPRGSIIVFNNYSQPALFIAFHHEELQFYRNSKHALIPTRSNSLLSSALLIGGILHRACLGDEGAGVEGALVAPGANVEHHVVFFSVLLLLGCC